MRPIRSAMILPLLLATTAYAADREATRYLDLSNRAHDSVSMLEVAPSGSGAFQEKLLGATLGGGGESTTIEITGKGCRYDFRLTFRNGGTRIYQDLDLCDGGRLVIRPLPRDRHESARSQGLARR